jgi:hypothetical protein
MKLERAGYYLNWRSGYLLERNWIQAALMGDCTEEMMTPLIELLRGEMKHRHRA